jgi:hypothetical protein
MMKSPTSLPDGVYLKRDWFGTVKSAWRWICGKGYRTRITIPVKPPAEVMVFPGQNNEGRAVTKAMIDDCVQYLKDRRDFSEAGNNVLILPSYHAGVSCEIYEYARSKGLRIVHQQ